jgi:hypothetical protein
MLVNERHDAPELTDVHRFIHPWEKTSSLDLRHGHISAIDTLIAHGRIHGTEEEQDLDAAYTAWRKDQAAGKASILVAETQQSVTALNQRARADRIIDGTINPARELPLHDGSAVCEGDLVITRCNDRRLRSGSSWVRNGDRWTVTRLREDGSATIRPTNRRFGGSIVLPAAYVAEHLDLGYAVTAHRTQGVTTDTSHVVVTSTTTPARCCSACSSASGPNPPPTKPSPLNKIVGVPSAGWPPSTRPSPRKPKPTAGIRCSPHPGSPANKSRTSLARTPTARCPPSYATPKPTTTSSTS